jgi:CBS domain-containing protein
VSIKQLMTAGVEVVAPDDPIRVAARKMADGDVGFIPVCDGKKLVGVITDRDIAVRAVAAGKDADTAVRDVMTDEVVYCFEDDAVERVARLMKQREIRRVLVVDKSKRLVGVVALGDLADAQPGESADVLQSVSEAPPSK